MSTIIACRRLAPADTVSGIGIARVVSVGAGEDGRGGKAVKVKGESGERGKGWMMGTAFVGVPLVAGISLACRGEAGARVCALGPRVGYGGAVGAVGREGGVEGRVFGAAVMDCDSFDGGRGPCVRPTRQSSVYFFWQTDKLVERGRVAKKKGSPQVVPSVIGAAVARPERYLRVRGCCSL